MIDNGVGDNTNECTAAAPNDDEEEEEMLTRITISSINDENVAFICIRDCEGLDFIKRYWMCLTRRCWNE